MVTFTPTASGVRVATLNLTSDDCDENPYNFAIQGNASGRYYSIANGNWENGATWSLTGFGGASCSCTPANGGKVYIGNAKVVSKSTATAYTIDTLRIDLTSILDVGMNGASITANVFSNQGIGGNGKLMLGGNAAPAIPAVTTNDFLNAPGTGASTIEYYATANYTTSIPATVQSLAFSGTNKITLANSASVRGDLTITGKLDVNTSILNQPVCCANTFTIGANAELHTNITGIFPIPFNFLTYNFDPTSTVYYYSIVNQNIYGGGAVIYGNLVLSGDSEKHGSGDVVTAGNVDVLGTTELYMDPFGFTNNVIGGNLTLQAGASLNFTTSGETITVNGDLIAPAGIVNMETASNNLLILNGASNQAGSLVTTCGWSNSAICWNCCTDCFPKFKLPDLGIGWRNNENLTRVSDDR